jgi:hypothetical protein
MVTVYSRMLARSSIWGGHAADGVDHNEAQGVPARANHDHASELQNDCRRAAALSQLS